MRRNIVLSGLDIKEPMSNMSQEEQTNLTQRLDQEILSTEQELQRSYLLLQVAKEKQRQLEIYKYEQTVRDLELELEKLERKKEMNQLKILKSSSETQPTGNPKNVVIQKPNAYSINQFKNVNKVEVYTKGLIRNFEKMNSISNSEPSHHIYTQNGLPSGDPSLPNKSTIKTPPALSQSSQPHFTQIKLKKVGLPPDAQEYDQTDHVNFAPQNDDFFERHYSSACLQPAKSSLRSMSVDIPRISDLTPKDKFHNPNKEIQVAIQNEIKEIKLKKTNVTSPTFNCPVEHVNMGKFHFSNERSLSTNSSISIPLSATKSMPFLDSISNSSFTLNEVRQNPPPSLRPIEEKLDIIYDESPYLGSFLQNWDPTAILKKLYTIQRKSDTKSYSNTDSDKITIDVDYVMGSNNGRPYKQGFILIMNGQFHFYENKGSLTGAHILDLKQISARTFQENIIEICDSRGVFCTIRCQKTSDCKMLLATLEAAASKITNEIVPKMYDDVSVIHQRKVLVIDIGGCSVRAGLLKVEPTLPGLYFPHVAAISRESKDVIEVGFEAFDVNISETSDIIRPLKPDTTLEDLAFTSGCVEATIKKICNFFQINPKEYIIMLSVPHNIAEATRSKLADVLLLRLNFKGVSMCGESLLALHVYGEATGILVDIGYRTEIVPVTYGVVQTSSIKRSLFGGHLVQVALSHLLPLELHSIVDFLLVRSIMEEVCVVAKNHETAHTYTECANVYLQQYNLPSSIPSCLVVQGKDRCLPMEGLFNPDVYSIDTCGLAQLIRQSIQSCPMDFRKDLYKSIYLSGATTQIPGLVDRLEKELKESLPSNCEVKVYASPDRAHFSYVGACFVASSDDFVSRVVERREWEDDRMSSLRKWHF